MAKSNKSAKLRIIPLVLSILMVLSFGLFALCACSTDDEEDDSSSETRTDTQTFSNADFEYFTDSDGSYVIGSADSWTSSSVSNDSSVSASSSSAKSGIVDTASSTVFDETSWEAYKDDPENSTFDWSGFYYAYKDYVYYDSLDEEDDADELEDAVYYTDVDNYYDIPGWDIYSAYLDSLNTDGESSVDFTDSDTILSDEYKDAFITAQEAILRADNRTLLVVVDTHRPEQVEDESLLTACSNRLAVIDHHRRAATYIKNATMSLYEPNASSTCELVTEMMQELVEQSDILPVEADAVLSGIVLDTKSFTLRTGERTFDAAAFLRRAGADPVRVKKMFQSGLDETLERYDIMKQARLYRGVAVSAVSEAQNRVVAAQAADELLTVAGVSASVVLYPTQDGGVAVSARSIGDMNVQVLLEKLGGGGNKSAAGAQMRDTSLRDAVNQLFAAIDNYLDTD